MTPLDFNPISGDIVAVAADFQTKGYHLAICLDCEPTYPQPFETSAVRDHWLFSHVTGTGHRCIVKSPSGSKEDRT